MNAPDRIISSDIDNLLDATLDDLADMPEFKPFPAGAHRCTIKWDYTKAVGNQKGVEIKLTALETIELTNADETPVKAGDTSNMLFMFKKKDGSANEIAQGKWKELLAPLQAHFGTATNRETMDASQGAEVIAITKIRTDKSDTNDVKHYTDIVSLAVV